ncbi:hypothetical protein KC799_20865, partial [candidate division KSB1 bacterium]|nr:hypothetical protein [candidate division KSB1 bacterium]
SAGFESTQLVRAHHGSLSREVRFEVESALKKGKLSGVVATASLELGIDIGSIDLVVQLDAPTSVSSALQRIGRSGHVLSATSKGRILPLYQSELPHAVAITEAILEAEVEETLIPELCLDVLSQQILAEVAVQDWSRNALFDLFRHSYCYRNLTTASFNRVIEMLGGAYEETQIRSLQPRLTWDKVNDKLIARRGARLLATMNGGTIPDRGLYDVYLQDANVRVGQVDEEFVFERKVGETFYLGTSEWRIETIAQDRIVVAPVRAIVPMPPFWKSDYGIPRDFNTMQRVGAFLRELLEDEAATDAFDHGLVDTSDGAGDIHCTINSAKASRRVIQRNDQTSTRRGRLCSSRMGESIIDPEITQSLHDFVDSQLDFSGAIATDRRIVFEYFHDSAQQPMLYIQAPFGGRVNQAWAIALATYLGKKYSIEIQYSFNDDGLLFRLLESDDFIPAQEICAIPPQQLEDYIIAGLPEAPVFMVLFRYNAGSSLLLTRSRAGKRIPLWLQRLRTADLMQNIRQYPDFPILLETYRDCLENVLDVRNLKIAIEQIQSGEIEVVSVQTLGPSPMANGLMYKFLERNLYEIDRNRGAASGGEVHQQALAEILQSGEIPAIITLELVEKLERRLQHLVHELKAKLTEDIFAILDKLGPLSVEALQQRSHVQVMDALAELQQAGRIVQHNDEWQTQTCVDKLHNTTIEEKTRFVVQRLLQNHGPMTGKAILNQLPGYTPEIVLKTLETLAEKRLVLHGQMIEEDTDSYWCDRHNFTTLYRQAIAARRQSDGIATSEQFYRFLLQWHHITTPAKGLDELVERYRGYRFASSAFEREIVRTRFPEENQTSTHLQEFSEALAHGDVIQRMHRSTDKSPRMCSFHRRGEGHLFFSKNVLLEKKNDLDASAQSVFAFLQENGASLFDDLIAGTELSRSQILDALKLLVENELLSCDEEQSLQYVLGIQQTGEASKPQSNALFPDQPWRARSHGRRRGVRSGFSQFKHQQKKLRGRWFLTTSFAVHGKEITQELLAEKQARLLLQRYGVLVKEWYRRENGLLPWYRLFAALKRLEWQGEIRRGYFVHGLSGVQYALPQAVQLLEKIQQKSENFEHSVVLISTGDPALPFGGMLQWNVRSLQNENVAITRSFSNHLLLSESKPILYLENFARRIYSLSGMSEGQLPEFIMHLKSWLRMPSVLRPVKNVTIESIDAQPAAKHGWASHFTQSGFEQSDTMLVLWPSAV